MHVASHHTHRRMLHFREAGGEPRDPVSGELGVSLKKSTVCGGIKRRAAFNNAHLFNYAYQRNERATGIRCCNTVPERNEGFLEFKHQ